MIIERGDKRSKLKTPKNKRPVNKIPFIILGILLGLVIIGGVTFYCIDRNSRIYSGCVLEAGTEILPDYFCKKEGITAEFTDPSEIPNPSQVGEYTVSVKSWIYRYKCSLVIQDTIAPTGEAADCEIEFGNTVMPIDLVTNVQDATVVSASFVTEPDYSAIGENSVDILLTDAGGNTCVVSSQLTVRPTVSEYTMEAGGSFPKLSDLLLFDTSSAKLKTYSDEYDLKKVGDYELQVSYGDDIYTTVLHVADTTASTVEWQDEEFFDSYPFDASSFAASYTDNGYVTFNYVTDPDLTVIGTQELTVRAVDEGGNTCEGTVSLTLKHDDEPPVIEGTADKIIYIGDTINYKSGVSVTDNCDTDITFDVDATGVDLNTAGTYQATYSATDRAGNETSVTINITVEKRNVTEEEVMQLAADVIAKIITPDMTGRQKLDAIYSYVRSHVGYVSHTDKGNWVQAAYEGFTIKQGDCYCFASITKALLTAAGIANRDIEKIPAHSSHYWNLVDIGEGWYHFDTTPRVDGAVFNYMDDATLMAYSNSHNLSHNYDRTVYTDIQ